MANTGRLGVRVARRRLQVLPAGVLGWSAMRRPGVYDGIELHASGLRPESCRLQEVSSSFFDDPRRFPPGTVERLTARC